MSILPNVKAWIRKNKLISKIIESKKFRTNVSIVLSVMYNAAYVATNSVLAVSYKSAWFLTVALYYGLLLVVSCMILRAEDGISTFPEKARRSCLLSGVLLLFASIPMGAMILAVKPEKTAIESSLLIGELVFYSVLNVIRVVYSIVQSKRNSLLLHRSVYTVRSVSAVIASFNLFVSMIPLSGGGRLFKAIFSVGVSLALFILPSVLIYSARKATELV